jgi:hypothetical protein
MSAKDFFSELRALGYSVDEYPGDRAVVTFEVPVGRFAGRVIRLGFEVPGDYPMTPPSGPHISPPLLPLHPQNDIPHPLGGVHERPEFAKIVGGEWQYWSRPFPEWGSSEKTARVYMAFIRHLFATQ